MRGRVGAAGLRMSSHDDDNELAFFEEPETLEAPRPARRRLAQRGPGPRRPAAPPPGAVGLARLAGLVALAIAIVVGLVVWIGGRGNHAGYASYLNSMRPIAQESARPGTEFAHELGSASLTLSTLKAKLEQWAQQEQQAYVAAQRLRPPGPLQAAHQEALASLQLRALGLSNLAVTLGRIGSQPASTAAQELATQAQLLSASDIVWRELFRTRAMQEVKAEGVTGVIVPVSLVVPNPEVVSAHSFSIVFSRLSATTGGKVTGLHGSALISTVAAGGGKTLTLSLTTVATVDVSADLALEVTFEDSGNYPEVKIPVTLSIVTAGQSVYSKTQTVAEIVAKQDQTVSFTNIQLPPAAFGHTTHVTVDVGKVPGETRLDNNQASYPVFFRLPTSG